MIGVSRDLENARMVYDKSPSPHNVVSASDQVRKAESRAGAGKRGQFVSPL